MQKASRERQWLKGGGGLLRWSRRICADAGCRTAFPSVLLRRNGSLLPFSAAFFLRKLLHLWQQRGNHAFLPWVGTKGQNLFLLPSVFSHFHLAFFCIFTLLSTWLGYDRVFEKWAGRVFLSCVLITVVWISVVLPFCLDFSIFCFYKDDIPKKSSFYHQLMFFMPHMFIIMCQTEALFNNFTYSPVVFICSLVQYMTCTCLHYLNKSLLITNLSKIVANCS